MRRLSLSTKMIAAAAPLVLAVTGLLALTVRSDLSTIAQAESGADLGAVWEPLIVALDAVEAEAASLTSADDASDAGSRTSSEDATNAPVFAAEPALRRATDQAINELRLAIENLGAFEAASEHITTGRSTLSAARRNIDMAAIAPQMTADVDPFEAYALASRELVAVGQLLPPEAGDPELGSELLAVVKLAEAKLHANDVIAGTSQWPNSTGNSTPLVQARAAFANMASTLGEFGAVAPDEWATQYRQSGFTTALGSFRTSLDSVSRAADAGNIETFDTPAFAEFTEQATGFQRSISQSIVDRANTDASSARTATLIRIGVILGAVVLAGLIAWFISRSITRRVKAVADSANQVANEQLPALVEALRDPRGKAVLPDIAPVDARGGDDLAELAHAFNSMQETLVDVANQQVEVLRRGVSDIFVTMARRNRSLIDRQLAMLDEYEASIDDPEVLGNYYQLDHLATRMRRNSESLLVLANAEPKRRRVKATEIDDVVRASIGEVEDYRRIEIQHLESLQVRGTVVADISHLLAELLDNATSFSPPDSPVRVGGRKAGDSYMLRIVDDGVGIGPDRLAELNELLREPPIVGLSVEATLGISVVSLLANKHDIEVTLSAGNPGLTVDVVLPGSLFGPIDAPIETPPMLATAASTDDATEQIVAWNDQPDAAHDELFETATAAADPVSPVVPVDSVGPVVPVIPVVEPTAEPATQPAATPEPEPVAATDDDEFVRYEREPIEAATPTPVPAPVAETSDRDADDWTTMSLDLSAFTTATPEPTVTEPAVSEPSASESAATLEPTVTEQAVSELTASEPSVGVPSVSEPTIPESIASESSVTEPAATLEPSVTEPAAPTDDTPSPTTGEAAPSDLPERTGLGAPDLAPSVPEPMDPAPTSDPAMPPPMPARAQGEFDTPLAPPVTGNGLAQRPVTPDNARRLPTPAVPAPDETPALPTRTNRTSGPDGPDRLTDPAFAAATEPAVASGEPGALQAALSAFDSGRSAVGVEAAGDLPTRARSDEPVAAFEDSTAVTQSRVDPAALRDRLRAFKTEFSNAGDAGNDHSTTPIHKTTDRGGDPR